MPTGCGTDERFLLVVEKNMNENIIFFHIM